MRDDCVDEDCDLAVAAEDRRALSRRRLLGAAGSVGVGVVALGAASALAQEAAQEGPATPPSTITTPPRDFGPTGAPSNYFWDPDVIAIDPSFNGLAQPNAPIQRLWTGAL